MTFTTYEAKSRFSEIMRRVRDGQRVLITYHGKEVAEIRPYEPAVDPKAALEDLERRGIVLPCEDPTAIPEPVAKRPGALARFLAERE